MSDPYKIGQGFLEAKRRAGFDRTPRKPEPAQLPVWLQRLLFRIHMRNTYPTHLTGPDGSKVPANIIRMSREAALTSSNIRPDTSRIQGDGHKRIITFDVYTPPGED